jgi:hypothetical protein
VISVCALCVGKQGNKRRGVGDLLFVFGCVIVFGIGSELLMTQCDNIGEAYQTIEHTIVIGGS